MLTLTLPQVRLHGGRGLARLLRGKILIHTPEIGNHHGNRPLEPVGQETGYELSQFMEKCMGRAKAALQTSVRDSTAYDAAHRTVCTIQVDRAENSWGFGLTCSVETNLNQLFI